VEDPSGYGVIGIDKDKRVTGFVEKPKKEEAPSNLASTGIYLMSSEVRKLCHDHELRALKATLRRLDFGMDLFPYLIKKGYHIAAYSIDGDWYDVGTPELYLNSMLRLMNSGYVRTLFGDPVYTAEGSKLWVLGQSAAALARREEILRKVRSGRIRIEGNVLIGRHCDVGDDVVLNDSYIDNYCCISDGVTIERSAIHDRVYIGEGAYIQDSIIARHAKIMSLRTEPTAVIGVSVVGDNALVQEGSFLTNARVDPHTYVSRESTVTRKALA